MSRCVSLWLLLAIAIFPAITALGHGAEVQTEQISASPDRHDVLPLVEPQGKADLQGVDQRLYRAAQNQARYLLGQVHPWSEDPSLLLLTESRSTEDGIRPNTGAVEGFCFLYRFGFYDAGQVGVSRSDLLKKFILPMMRYLVATHVTGTRPTSDGRRWGDAWQSAHWAQMLGRSAWWTWNDLPQDLRDGVRRVVAHEAERIAQATPPHQIQQDTKAEENAWNSRILSVAVLLLPGDPRRQVWEAAFQKWAFSSFLRPADAHSQALVDGRKVAEQFTGANIYDDFTLENHNIVHPDYMTCFSLSLGAALDYTMSNRKPPECLWHNVAGLYENLKWFVLPDGGFVYPNGQDWQLFRNPDWIAVHLEMAVFGRDANAWTLACRSLDTLEKMQARSASGVAYAPGETFFASSQTDLFRSLGLAWLTVRTADHIDRKPGDPQGVRRLDSARIILRRTGSAVHTFSWGAKIMAQCVPYRLDRIVSPHQASGIGHIVVTDQRRPLTLYVRNVVVRHGHDEFAADLLLDHGTDQIRADLQYRSKPDGTWTVHERLTALSDLTTGEIATGLIGILNNPNWVYERGQRELVIDGQAHAIPSLSGKRIASDNAREIAVDAVLYIRSQKPLRICYFGAAKLEKARATDELYLNYIEGERTWRAGQVISEFEATIDCRPP